MVSRYEHFLFLISGIYRNIQKIERDEMVKYGYKGAYAQYLAVMKRHPNGVTAAQLCDLCEKDKAAVSRVINEMAEKGLVVRETVGDKLYRALIHLTEDGKKAADFVCERAQIAVEAAGNGLTDEERRTFYAALDRIASRLQTISACGIPNQQKGEHSCER